MLFFPRMRFLLVPLLLSLLTVVVPPAPPAPPPAATRVAPATTHPQGPPRPPTAPLPPQPHPQPISHPAQALQQGSGSSTDSTTQPSLALTTGAPPLAMVPNHGQTHPQVRFLAHTPVGTLFFTPQTVVMALPLPDTTTDVRARRPDLPADAMQAVLRLRWDGAHPHPTIQGVEPLPSQVHYLTGSDRAAWHTDLQPTAAVVYTDLYAGIDLRFDGTDGLIKSTYTVAPHQDPHQIRWRYQGATNLRIDDTGSLRITLPMAPHQTTPITLTEQPPVAWQVIAGTRQFIDVRYQLDGRTVQFLLGAYDPTHPLIIDPTITYGSYLAGSRDDWGRAIATDTDGMVYVAGDTQSSTDFPTSPQAVQPVCGANPSGVCRSDAFITKLDPTQTGAASLIYSTYLGGAGDEQAYGVAVDAQGRATVVGSTHSDDFPTTSGVVQSTYVDEWDAFVTQLTPDGSGLRWSTYLGGEGDDGARAVALDPAGNVALTGYTRNTPLAFPTTSNAYDQTHNGGVDDLFVTFLNSTATTLQYSTLLGGSRSDDGFGIAIDPQGHLVVGGTSDSTSRMAGQTAFPTTSDALQTDVPGGPTCPGGNYCPDAVIAVIDPQMVGHASLVYSTYLGGSQTDRGTALTVDQTGPLSCRSNGVDRLSTASGGR